MYATSPRVTTQPLLPQLFRNVVVQIVYHIFYKNGMKLAQGNITSWNLIWGGPP